AKRFHARQHHAGAVANDLHPILSRWIARWGGHQAVGPSAAVGADEENAAWRILRASGMVVHVVFVAIFALRDALKFPEGLVRAQIAKFAGGVAVADQQQVRAAPGALNIDAKALVLLLIDQRVRSLCAQAVAPQLVRPLGYLILHDVKECLVVAGPRRAGHALHAKG